MIKPILFNTEMVKAILTGRKTVTRRLIRAELLPPLYAVDRPSEIKIENGFAHFIWSQFESAKGGYKIKLPYQPDDVLYVRETWCKFRNITNGAWQYFYRADDNNLDCNWRPSIHMPKEAARIFLRVTDVRVERLQDVTLDDAIAEGCQGKFIGCGECVGAGWEILPEDEFADVWNSTIKKSDLDKYGWTANPWVWVIGFERISKEEALKNDK